MKISSIGINFNLSRRLMSHYLFIIEILIFHVILASVVGRYLTGDADSLIRSGYRLVHSEPKLSLFPTKNMTLIFINEIYMTLC